VYANAWGGKADLKATAEQLAALFAPVDGQ